MPGLYDAQPRTDPVPDDDRPIVVTRTALTNALRVTLAGELDRHSVPDAEQKLRLAERDPLDIEIDLRGVTFMDAAGLAMIIDADRRARAAGRRLTVCVGSPCVRRLFALTRAERSLDVIFDTAER